LLQHLVSSLSVSGRTVHRLRAELVNKNKFKTHIRSYILGVHDVTLQEDICLQEHGREKVTPHCFSFSVRRTARRVGDGLATERDSFLELSRRRFGNLERHES
jgi:hypothetical protein